MKRIVKNNPAFTMIELVLVIVVIGILAALAIPRFERDLRQEAADNVLAAIRYTQHLALTDDKTNPFDTQWQKTLWMIRFEHSGNDWYYIIGSNMDHGTDIDHNESAIDPANGKYMSSGNAVIDSDESPNIFISKKYGISSVTFNDCQGTTSSSALHVAFDHLGRPFRGIIGASVTTTNTYKNYVSNKDCNITFGFADPDIDSFSVIVTKETGYAYIADQPDS